MRRITSSLEGYCSMEVDSVGRSGGLAFLWRKEFRVSLRSASMHYMDLDIGEGAVMWRLTGFYGWPLVQDRYLSWQLLRILAEEDHSSWLCIGDFNEILFANEMKGGTRAQWQMNNFREAVDVCGLCDLSYEGYEFTYDNGQGGVDNRQCRLDRAMKTEAWSEQFPYAKLFHLSREWSDHAPIMVKLDGRAVGGVEMGKQFRFEQIWVGEEGCEDTIRRVWEVDDGDVLETISRCAVELKKWKGVSIGKILRDLARKRKRLAWLNENERSVANVKERKRLMGEINLLLRQEEVFWRQRSRALWLREGDRNTKYFHRKARQRKKKNTIHQVVGRDGTVCVGREVVTVEAEGFFTELFKSAEPEQVEGLFDGVRGRVTPAMNENFRAAYREEEVVEALSQMHPLKAPGPDGMNALFYQTYWHIVGPSVTRMVLGVLNGGEFPCSINRTHIVLIPKKKAPVKLADYRPISLCNVLYKLISKVLANRLKLVLGMLVSENQSAFTPGRLISDNILVAFELFHYMKNSRSSGGHLALKLDMAKAYDRVEWGFLHKVLFAMGFDVAWVDNVMRCVRTVTYGVLVNGVPSRVVVPECGLRQGDPISPYLFILCAEVLSSLLRRECERGGIHGIRVAPQAPVVSHLFFADDSIIFVKANVREAKCVMGILQMYEKASGQLVSKEKTTVSFSKGTEERRRLAVEAVLGVRVVAEHDRYLGLPTVIGSSKQVLTRVVRDKLSNKLQGWRGMLFSRAGREVLIKAVAQSIPTYAMSVFRLPANFCDELRSMVSKFWWGSDNGKRKMSWVAWSTLCRSKARGGLGFRDFENFNRALLAKQAWRLGCEDGSLMGRVLKGKYFPTCSFMDAEIGINPSYTWRSILGAKEVMGLGIRRRVGSGMDVRVWTDPWVPGSRSRCVISPRADANIDMRVAELFVDGEQRWDEVKISELFLPFEAERIRSIRIGDVGDVDSWVWDHTRDGEYSVKTGYRLLVEDGASDVEQSDFANEGWLWKAIWKVPVLPRIKVFMWKLCHEAIPTKVNIARRLGGDDVACPRCHSERESCLHAIRGCGWGHEIWEEVGIGTGVWRGVVLVRDWVEATLRELGEKERVLFLVTCWVLWERRNRLVFEEERWDVGGIMRRIWGIIWEMESVQDNKVSSNVEGSRLGSWEPPSSGVSKINTDAGVVEGVGVGLGAVSRNSAGEVEWAVVLQRGSGCAVDLAEAEAILLGLREAFRMQSRKVVIESDCLVVVDDLIKNRSGRSEVFAIYEEIRQLSLSFESVVIKYISRKFNNLAHMLAHAMPWVHGSRFWTSDLPAEFGIVALSDARNII
ncbi:uncharacterized protein LOC141602272 [Silene latifolia]|uniref:uncharacterized protein LOC141602272 n=1 Tax=Silene latifolia TaxID=37657 RepID=UPI003D787161